MKAGTFRAQNIEVAGLNGPDGNVTLGFRAEDASVAIQSGAQITAPVYSMELLGDATMITVRSGQAMMAVKADKEFRAAIGDSFSASVPPSICHLFNTETGERL